MNIVRAETAIKDKEARYDASSSENDLLALNRAQALHLRALADEEAF